MLSQHQGFLRSSQCQLQRLQLKEDFLNTSRLLKLLEQTPTLEHLNIDGGHGQHGIFQALTVKEGSELDASPKGRSKRVLVPRLTQLDTTIILCPRNQRQLEKELAAQRVEGPSDRGDGSKADEIYSMVQSRRQKHGQIGDEDVACMRFFRLSVQHYGPNVDTGRWINRFRSSTVPRLRNLTKDGLQLELEINTMTKRQQVRWHFDWKDESSSDEDSEGQTNDEDDED
ncbi:hypothetical protein D9758_016868 [Tetrapyrgos nigripes]|uniref:Uncharacterized protein n=1 Tax=Tetrapyrgos nigripes TaxID=182062 RepID=A0A8H5FCC1_9AGAR|nr:hypothetical protein D9758_016868 [Tetrapyrgos nigripes]